MYTITAETKFPFENRITARIAAVDRKTNRPTWVTYPTEAIVYFTSVSAAEAWFREAIRDKSFRDRINSNPMVVEVTYTPVQILEELT